MLRNNYFVIFPGLQSDVVPPLPIPNRVVKRISAYDNALTRVCENWSRPGFFMAKSVLF
jgi:hypothetical protein